MDFTVDWSNKVHALLYTGDRSRPCVVRRFASFASATDIVVRGSFRKIGVDEDGAYYLLDLLEEDQFALKSFATRGTDPGRRSVHLVHRVSSEGDLIGSFLPHPVSRYPDDVVTFMKSFPGLSDLAVLSGGEVLVMLHDVRSLDVRDVRQGLYRIDITGKVSTPSFPPPPFEGAFALGMLKFGPDDVALEWLSVGRPRLLGLVGLNDEATIYRVENPVAKRAVAVSKSEVLIVETSGSPSLSDDRVSRLYRVPLAGEWIRAASTRAWRFSERSRLREWCAR